ncbi:MAG TPA: AbrB/MazE/SpoVT family DNA-binding domain-containing protein [Rhizomicrobium sp.]|nr:AbrB/MazE/SpoVT family DNA-binding domain-containing protein [Rhizomicrobium sp.]
MTTNMTSKGQVTIPKKVRDAAGLKPGRPVHVRFEAGKVVLEAAGKKPQSPFAKVRGTLKGTPTTDEIMKLLRGD